MTRTYRFAIVVALGASLLGCNKEPEEQAAAPVASAPPAVAAAVQAIIAPLHGGAIVELGTAKLEVVLKSDGMVQAYPVAAVAAAGAEGAVTVVPPTASVVVNVSTATGQPKPVELAWATSGAFEGRLAGAVVRPGPIAVTVANAGPAPLSGRLEAAAIVPASARGGAIVDVGDARLEILAATDGTVQAYPIFPTVASIEVIPPTASLTVDVSTQAGTKPVTLAWQPAIATFTGRLEGAEITPGPAAVHVVRGEARFEASLRAITIAPPTAMVVVEPPHGGTVVDVEGGNQVELVVVDDGSVEAYPVATYIGAPAFSADAQVTVNVPIRAAEPRPVALAWEAETGCFRGRVTGARVDHGVAGVVLVRGQGTFRGEHPIRLVPARGHRVERVRAVVVAPPPPAANIAVQVTPPSVQATVVVPPPPSARVTVVAPAPPSARVTIVAPPPPSVRATATVGGGGNVNAGARATAGGGAGARVQVRLPQPPSVRVQGGIRIGGGASTGTR